MRPRETDSIAEIAAELGPVIGPVVIKLARAVARAELAAAEDGADPWIDHRRWPCASRRAACELARSGAIEGVRRVGAGRGSLWLARRSALDAYIERHGEPLAAEKLAANDADEPTVDDVHRELGLERVRPRARGAR